MKVVSGLAALVPTASDCREKDDNVPVLTGQMRELGLEAQCVDVEFENPARLLMYDVVILMGGNPYPLLAHLKKWPNCGKVIRKLSKEHILVGISAGSMVLGKSISVARDITPEDADGYQDEEGFGLANFSIMPHYVAYQTVFPGMDEILKKRRQEGADIRTVSDREAFVWEPNKKCLTYLADSGYQPVVRDGLAADSMDIVIFDLYGTMIDIYTDERQQELWEKMCLFYGYQGAHYSAGELRDAYEELVWREEDRVRASGEEFPEISLENVFAGLYRRKGVRAGKVLVRSTGQMFRALSTRYIRLYYGARELLAALKKSGKKLYALSNAQRLFTEYEMKMLGIYRLFDGVYLSSDFGSKKPSGRFYNCLLDEIPSVPTNILMVGNNREDDIVPAKKLGLYTCYIQSNLSPAIHERPDSDIFLGYMNLPELTKCLVPGSRN